MAEIGAALREARTRARIEIAQMEAQTKIRAKYLRALENEEWELLPGPTYVKSFLKTYGDMLGLDGRQLVAEYKSAREPFQAVDDIGQMSKHTGGRMNRQIAPPIGRWATIAAVVIVIAAGVGYAVFGPGSGDDKAPSATSGVAVVPDTSVGTTPKTAKVQSVVVTATASVTVCARAGKRIVVPATKLRTGQKTKTVRGRAIIVTADSRSVRVTVNGKRRALPASTGPITVVVSGSELKKAGAATTACRA